MTRPVPRPRASGENVSRCPGCGAWRYDDRPCTTHPRRVWTDPAVVYGAALGLVAVVMFLIGTR